MNNPIQGSYAASDCLFLMQTVEADYQTVENKEKLIQSGAKHYSEMINKEDAPTAEYVELFGSMMETYKGRLAAETMKLASKVADLREGYGDSEEKPIVILSLARAGTPIGVLLKRALEKLGKTSVHFSISIIRDRSIDGEALKYVLERYEDLSIVFVDGWTAKGVITRELHESVEEFNGVYDCNIPKDLFVISDIGGTADVTATYDDYTIPSALMNSTVSGLMSRTILTDEIIASGGFHGCVKYDHLLEHDRSNWFIDEIAELLDPEVMCDELNVSKEERQEMTKKFLDEVMTEYGVSDINRIKPGIAEATRVMLRRVPDLLMVQEKGHPDVAHLERIALEKNITVVELPNMPFGACSLIKDVL
ncbi:cysteine protease StiP family protein [Vibrio owensii]|uniref:cysteine protease StiP family protein n=1 Tax=Vibrio owensii TaxID=696485 RepID=UPI003CC58642